MAKMTEEDRTKNNMVAEMMDSLFEFKPGDLIANRSDFEQVKLEFALNDIKESARYQRLGVLRPLVVAERVLKECPGNTQCFYTGTVRHTHDGQLVTTAFCLLDKEAIAFSIVEEFYRNTRAKLDEARAQGK